MSVRPARAMAVGAMLVASIGMTPVVASAQDAVAEPLEVGAVAPDFVVPGATRYGILEEPVSLSEFEGKTVVLSFFYAARTKG